MKKEKENTSETKVKTTKIPLKKKAQKKKTKKKRAFTLIELLAVIIILGILMIIAIPSVTNYISDSRKNAYVNTAKSIMDGARAKVNEGKLNLYNPNTTYYIPNTCISTENIKKSPYGDFTKAYVVVTYNSNGDGFKYYWTSTDTSQMGIKTITNYDELSIDNVISNVKDEDINTKVGINGRENIEIFNSDCTSSDNIIALTMLDTDTKENTKAIIKCVTDGELTQGKEFVDGQFTYRYMQEKDYNNNWVNISTEGWGVSLTDKNSTEEINTNLCTTINDKPLVSTSYMFNNSKTTNINTESYNTINVTNMTGMFSYIQNVKELDLSTFNTSSVTNFKSMFNGASNIEKLNMDNFNLSSLTSESNLGSMFSGMNKIKEISMKKWIIPVKLESAVGCRYSSLCSNSLEKIDVSNWHLGKTKNIEGLFGNYPGKRIIGLDTWDTSNITNMTYLFTNSENLEEINLNNFIKGNNTAMPMMFSGCKKLEKVYMDNWDLSNAGSSSIGGGFFSGTNGIKYISAKNWKLPKNFEHWISRSWSAASSPIEEIDVTGWDLTKTESIMGLFADSKSLIKVTGLNTWDTSNITNMLQLFYNCPKLEKLDLSSFDMSNAINTTQMLSSTKKLNEIITPKKYPSNQNVTIQLEKTYKDNEGINYTLLKNGDKTTVKIIKTETTAFLDTGPIVNAKLKKLSGSSYANERTSNKNIKNIYRSTIKPDFNQMTDDNIISESNSKTKVYAWFDNNNIYIYSDSDDIYLNKDSSYLFYWFENLESVDIKTFDFSKVENMSYAFSYVGNKNKLTNIIGLESIEVQNVKKMSYTFYYAYISNISDISNWNVQNIVYMDNMFYGFAYYNTGAFTINLSNWNVSNLENMSNLFAYSMQNATGVNIDLSGWDIRNVKEMSYAFYYCFLRANQINLNVSGWTITSTVNKSNLFNYIGEYAVNIKINVSNWIFETNDISSLFYSFGQWATNSVEFRGLSTWDVSNITDMSNLFANSGTNAKTWKIDSISYWDTRNVTNMSGMFNRVGWGSNNINLGTIKTYSSNIEYMFYGSKNITANFYIYNKPEKFSKIFEQAASNGRITVNYTSAVSNINYIISTKSSNSNVVKGSVIR